MSRNLVFLYDQLYLVAVVRWSTDFALMFGRHLMHKLVASIRPIDVVFAITFVADTQVTVLF